MARAPEPDPVEWVRERWDQQGLPESDRFAAVASLLRTHQVTVAALEGALRPLGLNRTTYFVLVTLALSNEGARRLSYLSRYLMVHPTTVTQVVDQMEEKGLVKREPHPTDRRTTLAVLTAKGRTALRKATTVAADAGFGMPDVDAATLRQLTTDLRAIRRAAGDLVD